MTGKQGRQGDGELSWQRLACQAHCGARGGGHSVLMAGPSVEL